MTRPSASVSQTPPTTANVAFALLAPNNAGASLIGSFSDWKEVPMRQDADGYFRVDVPLADGDYLYRFKVQSRSWFFEPNQVVDVIDPYATEITVEGDNGVLHVRGGKRIIDEYVWQHDAHPLPPDNRLVIYELHAADFIDQKTDQHQRGRFTDIVDKLEYLADLGVNAIELMPIKDNPGQYSWGYNPRHFCAVDTNYGGSADLKRLIDECHGRGIRVFIDGVYNHAESSTPLTQIDHDYWFRHDPKDKENNWGPEFYYEYFDDKRQLWPARKFVTDTVAFWVREYHIDGIRYDASRQIDNFDAMREFVSAARQAAGPKPFYNVAEYVPQNPAVTNVDGPMDAAWHDNFYHTINEQLTGDGFDAERLKDAIDGRREGFGAAINMVNYCSNHDHNHVLADLGDKGIFDDAAFAKAKQGAVICLTAVGVPLLWMGEEFGEYKYKSEGESKLHWNLLAEERNQTLFKYYQKLISLRTQHAALCGDNIDFFFEDLEQRLLGYSRWEGDAGIIVMANFSGSPVTAEIPNWPPGHWESLMGVKVDGPGVSLLMEPFDAKIFLSTSA